MMLSATALAAAHPYICVFLSYNDKGALKIIYYSKITKQSFEGALKL